MGAVYVRFFERKVCSPEDKVGRKKKGTAVNRIAIQNRVMGTGLVATRTLAKRGMDYNPSGVWTGYFDNGQASPQPYP